MKIVDAFWEKRNLGVDCKEFTVEDGDSAGDVMGALNSHQARYMVVKAPVAGAGVMFALSAAGYTFIECGIHATHDLLEVKLSGIEKRMSDAVRYSLMEPADMEFMYEKIRGGIFSTDRVSLDPRFTQEQAANRYVCWIEDETARGADCYKLLYKDRAIGFFTLKNLGNGIYYPFLSSMYDYMEYPGLGYNATYKAICEIVRREGKLLSTYLSSNNSSAVSVALSLGFMLKEMFYVYIKHND